MASITGVATFAGFMVNLASRFKGLLLYIDAIVYIAPNKLLSYIVIICVFQRKDHRKNGIILGIIISLKN